MSNFRAFIEEIGIDWDEYKGFPEASKREWYLTYERAKASAAPQDINTSEIGRKMDAIIQSNETLIQIVEIQKQSNETLTQKVIEMESELSSITSKFQSVSITEMNITPSETCSSKCDSEFTSVLEWLKLDNSSNLMDRVSSHTFDSTILPPFVSFQWNKRKENVGYPELLRYLTKDCGFFAKIVSDGQGKQVLFDERVFSLRDRLVDGLTLSNENRIPIYKFRIRGRTDLVVLDDDVYGKSHVKFAIEVKPVGLMTTPADENQALREAFLQLIGLNVNNCYKSPAVILTNLNSKHYVLYLTLRGDPDTSLAYNLNIHKSSKLNEIINFSNELSNRASITSKLGTNLTPLSSERGNDEFGNVELTVNPVEDLEGLDDPET